VENESLVDLTRQVACTRRAPCLDDMTFLETNVSETKRKPGHPRAAQVPRQKHETSLQYQIGP
jgi:hypothetical protein